MSASTTTMAILPSTSNGVNADADDDAMETSSPIRPEHTSSPSPPHNHYSKKVAIIGGGVSGIICASVLKQEGHEVRILEQESQMGGVWLTAYPGAQLQNRWYQYCHANFAKTEEDGADDEERAVLKELEDFRMEYPMAPQVLHYWQACARHFDLDATLNAKVVELKERPNGNGWLVVWTEESSSSTATNESSSSDVPEEAPKRRLQVADDADATASSPRTPKEEEFDFVIVAQGQFSRKDISIPWQGVEAFQEHEGIIKTRLDFVPEGDLSHLLKDKRVAIIGFGRTALDFCVKSVQHGASSTMHVFRTAHQYPPLYPLGLSLDYWSASRFFTDPIPCWGHPSRAWTFIHTQITCFIYGSMYLMKFLLWTQVSSIGWFRSRTIRQRIKLLKSKLPLWKEHRTGTAIYPESFFRYVADDKLVPVLGDIQRLTPQGLLLADGREISADVIIVCIGNGNQAATFPYLPTNYRESLEQDPNGAQLYRHLVAPDVPNLALMGWNHGTMHCAHIYLGSLWLSTLLKGEMNLPPPDEQRQVIQRITEWKRRHIYPSSNENANIASRAMQYNDTLMLDMGLRKERKPHGLAELFAPYGPMDYRNVLSELEACRRNAAAVNPGRLLELRPISIDM